MFQGATQGRLFGKTVDDNTDKEAKESRYAVQSLYSIWETDYLRFKLCR